MLKSEQRSEKANENENETHSGRELVLTLSHHNVQCYTTRTMAVALVGVLPVYERRFLSLLLGQLGANTVNILADHCSAMRVRCCSLFFSRLLTTRVIPRLVAGAVYTTRLLLVCGLWFAAIMSLTHSIVHFPLRECICSAVCRTCARPRHIHQQLPSSVILP